MFPFILVLTLTSLFLSLTSASGAQFTKLVTGADDRKALQIELAEFFSSHTTDFSVITTWEEPMVVRLLSCDLSAIFPKVQENAKPFEDVIHAISTSVKNLPAAQVTLIYQVDWRLTQAIMLDQFHSTIKTIDMIDQLWTLRNSLLTRSHPLVHKAFSFVTYPLFHLFLGIPDSCVERWMQRLDFARMETYVYMSSEECVQLLYTVWDLRACMSAVLAPFVDATTNASSLINDLIVTYDRKATQKSPLFHSHRMALLGFWVFASRGTKILVRPWDKLLAIFMPEFQALLGYIFANHPSIVTHLHGPSVPYSLQFLLCGEEYERTSKVVRLPKIDRSFSECILTNSKLAIEFSDFRSAYLAIVDHTFLDGGPLRILNDLALYDTMELPELAHELFDRVYDIDPLINAPSQAIAESEFRKLCDALHVEQTTELCKTLFGPGANHLTSLYGFMWHLMTVYWIPRVAYPVEQVVEESLMTFRQASQVIAKASKSYISKHQQLAAIDDIVQALGSNVSVVMSAKQRDFLLAHLLKLLPRNPSLSEEICKCIAMIVDCNRRLAISIPPKEFSEARIVLSKFPTPVPSSRTGIFAKSLQAWLLRGDPSHDPLNTIGVAFSHLTSAQQALAVRSSVVMPVSLFEAGGTLYERPFGEWPRPQALRALALMLSFMHDAEFSPIDRWELGSWAPMELSRALLDASNALCEPTRFMIAKHFPCIDEAVVNDGLARRRIFKVLYELYLPAEKIDTANASWTDFLHALESAYERVMTEHHVNIIFWKTWSSQAEPDFVLWLQFMQDVAKKSIPTSLAVQRLCTLYSFIRDHKIGVDQRLGLPLLSLFRKVPLSFTGPPIVFGIELAMIRTLSRSVRRYFVAKERLSRFLYHMSSSTPVFQAYSNLLSPFMDFGKAEYARTLLPLLSQDLRLVATIESATNKSDLLAIGMLECLADIATFVPSRSFGDVAGLVQCKLLEYDSPKLLEPLNILPDVFDAANKHPALIPKLQTLMTCWDRMLNEWILSQPPQLTPAICLTRIRLVRCVRDQLLTLPPDSLTLVAHFCRNGFRKQAKHEAVPKLVELADIIQALKKATL